MTSLLDLTDTNSIKDALDPVFSGTLNLYVYLSSEDLSYIYDGLATYASTEGKWKPPIDLVINYMLGRKGRKL